METPVNHARIWLQAEYNRRREKNPQYSLRAFSRHLSLPSGRLSEILSNKRRISKKLGEKLAAQLALSPEQRLRLLEGIEREKKGLPPAQEVEASTALEHSLSEDTSQVIADWYHFAILSLMRLKEFRSDAKWISRRLGISSTEARIALDRMERVGLIRKDGKRLVLTHQDLWIPDGVGPAALKRGHKQLIEKALASIDEVPREKRDITSMTMAINPRKIPAAKEMIRDFRKKLCAYLEDGDETEVYNICVQLFPLSKRGTRK